MIKVGRVVTVTAIALVLLVALTSCSPVAREREVTISAASDLMAAFAEVRDLFERRTQIRVRINFGSTGQLTQQIEQGAPVDLLTMPTALISSATKLIARTRSSNT